MCAVSLAPLQRTLCLRPVCRKIYYFHVVPYIVLAPGNPCNIQKNHFFWSRLIRFALRREFQNYGPLKISNLDIARIPGNQVDMAFELCLLTFLRIAPERFFCSLPLHVLPLIIQVQMFVYGSSAGLSSPIIYNRRNLFFSNARVTLLPQQRLNNFQERQPIFIENFSLEEIVGSLNDYENISENREPMSMPTCFSCFEFFTHGIIL